MPFLYPSIKLIFEVNNVDVKCLSVGNEKRVIINNYAPFLNHNVRQTEHGTSDFFRYGNFSFITGKGTQGVSFHLEDVFTCVANEAGHIAVILKPDFVWPQTHDERQQEIAERIEAKGGKVYWEFTEQGLVARETPLTTWAD